MKFLRVLSVISLIAVLFSGFAFADSKGFSFAITERITYEEHSKKVSVSKNAEYIDMGIVTIQDYSKFIKFLKKLPNLKKVDMYSTRIKRQQIEQLAKAFPNVEFGWTIVIPCTNKLHPERTPHIIRTDATAFSTLHNNTCTNHTDLDLSVLKYCKKLKALDVGHNLLTDVSFLYEMPHLKVLILACNINLRDITPVGSLKELQYLELFKNDIHDISCLANCTELVDLNICFNRIGNLTPVLGLKKLRRFWLFNSNNWSTEIPVPAETVRKVKAALPDCYIDSTSWSTEGGWRQHPRYDTIYEMFWGTEYIPFTTLD